jgi:K+-sensing histidine kinase KdpD
MGTRGELRIYLGAAPGVGKTYAMLGEAHRRAGRGTVVVVGLAEPHGRYASSTPVAECPPTGSTGCSPRSSAWATGGTAGSASG